MGALQDIQSRISAYDEQSASYDDTILQKSLDADKYEKAALEPKKTSLQDALISSVIQVLPGLLGYAASGKGGAAIGLQGGLQGGQLYNQILDEKHESGQKQNLLLAKQANDDLSAAQQLKSKVDTRNLSLQDKVAFADYKDGQIRGRDSNRAGQTEQLLGMLQDSGYLKGPETEGAEGSTQASLPTTEKTNTKALVEQLQDTEAGRQILEQDPGFFKKILDAEGKSLTNQKTEQGVIQSKAETEKTNTEVILLRDQVTDLGRYKDIGTSGIPLPDAGIAIVPRGTPPNGATEEGRKELDQLKHLSASYEDVIGKLAALSSIINDKNAVQRMGNSQGPDIKKALIKSLARFSTIADTGNKAPNDAERNAAADRLSGLDIDGAWNNIKEQGSAVSLPFIKSFQQQIRSIISTETNFFERQLRKYGMGMERINDAGSNKISRFNEQSNVKDYIHPETKETILVDEGGNGR